MVIIISSSSSLSIADVGVRKRRERRGRRSGDRFPSFCRWLCLCSQDRRHNGLVIEYLYVCMYVCMYLICQMQTTDISHNKTAYTVAGQRGTACTNNCPCYYCYHGTIWTHYIALFWFNINNFFKKMYLLFARNNILERHRAIMQTYL